MVNPYNAAGAAAGAGVGGLLGRALNALDYPRQALWNIPDKIAQGDYAAAVPGLLGVGAGIGTAALGGGLPLAFLAGSLAGGAGQAVGSSVDEGRFQAPTAQDLTGSDDWLLNTLTSMAGDPLTYAGGAAGRAGANALRPKSVLEKYPTTGFYGELPDAGKPLVTLAQEAPKPPPPPDMSPLSLPHEYTFAPPTGGAATQPTGDAVRQYLNMLHDLNIERDAGLVSPREAMRIESELWRKITDAYHSMPDEAIASFDDQMFPIVRDRAGTLFDLEDTASVVGMPPRHPAMVDLRRQYGALDSLTQSTMAAGIKPMKLPAGVTFDAARQVPFVQPEILDQLKASNAWLQSKVDPLGGLQGEAFHGDAALQEPAVTDLVRRLRELGMGLGRRRVREARQRFLGLLPEPPAFEMTPIDNPNVG